MARARKKSSLQSVRTAASAKLTPAVLAAMEDEFQANPTYEIIQNAITSVSVASLAKRRSVVTEADHSFSVRLDDWPVTNQKSSGRCWMFAGLNLFRAGAINKMKVKNFEFSQNHVMFWDKIEKANHFLETIIETRKLTQDDRTVAFLLKDPIGDGGQWNMFVNVIRKHGLVPKAAMPETESSSSTRVMNGRLVAKLRQSAKLLRDMHAGGASLHDLRQTKHDVLKVAHRILSMHLGTPPTRFDWQWQDKKKKFHRDANMTPHRFAAKYVTVPMDDYVCLVHDPRKTSPTGRVFTVKHLGNVVGGEVVKYLNVDVALMKRIAMRTLRDSEPVWFGCDVGKQMDRELGLWDANLLDYDRLYDTTFAMDKASRLEYGAACMTHAMLFTGVDIKAGKPRRWRVENSWGDKGGEKGFYVMNDSWFDEHVFEIAARRKYLPAKLLAALDRKPIVLPPWDPMGSLAR